MTNPKFKVGAILTSKTDPNLHRIVTNVTPHYYMVARSDKKGFNTRNPIPLGISYVHKLYRSKSTMELIEEITI